MHFRALGVATPPARYTKADCLSAFQRSEWYARLDARSHLIARTVMERDNGIEARRLALDSIDEVFAIDPNTLAKRFLKHAPTIAAEAGRRALEKSGLPAEAIGAIVISTCTGYVCPGLSGYVVERLGLRADLQAFDLVGQGCAAALPNLQLGARAARIRYVRTRAVDLRRGEQCGDVPRQRSRRADQRVPVRRRCGRGGVVAPRRAGVPGASSGSTAHRSIEPGQRERADVRAARRHVAQHPDARRARARRRCTRGVCSTSCLQRAGLSVRDVSAWIMHAGGRDVLLAIERRFELASADLRYSAAMLREYGNLSSAFVYFVLDAALADDAADGWWWLSSFGAGFSCHGALLKVQR